MLLLQVELLTGTKRVSLARFASKFSHLIASHNDPSILLFYISLITVLEKDDHYRNSNNNERYSNYIDPCTLEKESRSEWLVVLSSEDEAGHFGRVHSGVEQGLQVVGVVVANSALHGTPGKVSL